MAQLFLFGLHWSHAGNLYYDAVLTGEKDELINYFNQHKRSDVTLVKIEFFGPEDMPIEQYLQRPARIVSEWWRQDCGQASKAHGT